MGTQASEVYDLEYFCLTDDNVLCCRCGDVISQKLPSEFQIGDELLSISKGKVQWVKSQKTKHTIRKEDSIVRLTTQRGTFYLTPGHKMFLENGTLEAAGNLESGDKLRFTNALSFPENKSIGIDKAYVLGSFAAEGSSQEGKSFDGHGKWRLVWGLHRDEEIFATKIQSYLVSAFPKSSCQIDVYPQYTRRTVSAYDKKLVLLFREMGALGLCYEKRIPSCVFSSTKAEKAAFISGLIEGDGTFDKNIIRLKLTSKALIDGTHLLLSDLGINSKLNFFETKNRDVFTLSIYGKENLSLFLFWTSRYLYGWKHLTKVQSYAKNLHGNTKHSIKDIEKALEALYPISSTKFSLQSGINQLSIKKIFGSWNRCLNYFGYKTKNSKWGKFHKPTESQFADKNFDWNGNTVIKVSFLTLSEDIDVYDFTVPVSENFLINTVCSHNSGSQMLLYIGDVWVDEVTHLHYNRVTTKQPIYGYASQLWDDVADGHVLVQGQFSINYKEQGYLWAILRRFKNISTNQALGAREKTSSDEKFDRALGINAGGYEDRRPVWGSNATKVNRASIERIASGTATRGQQYKFYHDLAGYSTFDVNSPKDKIFEDIVEEFEDQIWSKGLQNSGLNGQIRNPDDSHFDGFDIYVTFGNYEVPTANHTVQKIIDVRLNSQTKTVKIDGEPIQEVYTFIARTTA